MCSVKVASAEHTGVQRSNSRYRVSGRQAGGSIDVNNLSCAGVGAKL